MKNLSVVRIVLCSLHESLSDHFANRISYVSHWPIMRVISSFHWLSHFHLLSNRLGICIFYEKAYSSNRGFTCRSFISECLVTKIQDPQLLKSISYSLIECRYLSSFPFFLFSLGKITKLLSLFSVYYHEGTFFPYPQFTPT